MSTYGTSSAVFGHSTTCCCADCIAADEAASRAVRPTYYWTNAPAARI